MNPVIEWHFWDYAFTLLLMLLTAITTAATMHHHYIIRMSPAITNERLENALDTDYGEEPGNDARGGPQTVEATPSSVTNHYNQLRNL